MKKIIMKSKMTSFVVWVLVVHAAYCVDLPRHDDEHTEVDSDSVRGRRDVIEEEKYYNIQSDNRKNIMSQPTPWLPGSLPADEDPTTKISLTNDNPQVLPLYQTTERVTDKPTGRGARASNENWIKLPFPGRDDQRDNILTPPQPSGDLINSRMPRVNFVTQNKQLEASESRNDKESVQRATRKDDLRTDFVRPEEAERSKQYKPVYPRQAVYYPEDPRRPYDDRYYANEDLLNRRDPYYDLYDRKRYYPGYGPRVDRYDDVYDNYVPRKPKRIIYYAHLPEVVRTPPSVDLRYRYTVDPHRRFDDDYNARTGRYDYRFRSRYPYAPLRKEERNYRDLAGSSTVNKDNKVEDKVTAAAVLPQKDDKYKTITNNSKAPTKNVINSHQYHDAGDYSSYNNQLSQKNYQDMVRPDDGYLRFEEPLFHRAIEDPYQRKY